MVDDTPIDVEAFVEVEFNGFEEGFGFKFLAFGNDLFEVHARFHVEGVLGDDGAFVEVHGDEMGGDADDFDALFVGLSIGLGAREAG